MSFQVEIVSPSQKRIDFVIPQVEVAQKVGEAFKNVRARATLPGFRRGKVPQNVLEGRFGKQIRQDVAADLIDFNFRLAVQGLEYVGQPKVAEQVNLVETADFTFSVVLEVRPEVEVKDYKGMVVDFPVEEVTDAQVESAARARLHVQARLVDAGEGHVIAEGDLVLTQIHEKDGDNWKEVAPGTMINTKGDRYYPGVEALLIGAQKGDEKVGEVNGKETKATVLGVQISAVPDLTDEAAAAAGFEGGVEGMKAAIRMELEARNNEAARNQARVNILQKLVAGNEVEVPPAMVDSHFQLLMEELRIQNTYRGKNPQQLRLSDAGRADMRRRAAFAAQASILLEGIARQENIEVSDADLEAKYQEIADQRGQRVEAIRGYFVKEGAVPELKKRILEERVLEFLLESSELVQPAAPAADAAPAEAAE